MCGFLLGILALFAVIKLVKHGRRCRGGGRGPWRGGGGYLRWLFEDLDTTPGQEKSIRETLDSLREHARDSKAELRKSVADLADALAGDELDHEKVGEAWVKQDKALDSIRMAALEAMGRIHDTLDPSQRERLAQLLRRGRLA